MTHVDYITLWSESRGEGGALGGSCLDRGKWEGSQGGLLGILV